MRIIGVDPRSARMMATDPATGEQCELDILKEVFSQPPAVMPYGPVLALYDVIGTKVRALAGRGLPRDLIDIHAASQLCSNIELETLGRRHAWDEEFSLSELKERLDGAEWYDDQAFADYGLSAEGITDLRMWALAWADDIRQRSNTGPTMKTTRANQSDVLSHPSCRPEPGDRHVSETPTLPSVSFILSVPKARVYKRRARDAAIMLW